MRFLFLLAALAATPAFAVPRVVAVLPPSVRGTEVTEKESAALDDGIRRTVEEAFSSLGFTVLTGDTTLQFLGDNGIDAAKVCEASCALSAARELKSEFFVTTTVTEDDAGLSGVVRVFESNSGQIRTIIKLAGRSVRALVRQFDDSGVESIRNAMGQGTPAAVALLSEIDTTCTLSDKSIELTAGKVVTLKLTAGNALLSCNADGYHGLTETLTLSAGQLMKYEVKLDRLPEKKAVERDFAGIRIGAGVGLLALGAGLYLAGTSKSANERLGAGAAYLSYGAYALVGAGVLTISLGVKALNDPEAGKKPAGSILSLGFCGSI